jgi:nanoRNase/pAp phosphatase (c-di-AMP/oligoRNAs hydrolase)
LLTCGIATATLNFLISVNLEDFVTIFYWMAFVLGKFGLLTFNFMFALYMMVLLERLLVIKRTIKWMTELNIEESMLVKDKCKDIQLNLNSKVIVPSATILEILDSLYEIVEIIQRVCSKMNSYFGKKES